MSKCKVECVEGSPLRNSYNVVWKYSRRCIYVYVAYIRNIYGEKRGKMKSDGDYNMI